MEILWGIRKYKVRATGIYVVALLLMVSIPAAGLGIADGAYDPPQWTEIIFSALWYTSIFVTVYPLVVVAGSPLLLLGQYILKISGNLSASRYLFAGIMGGVAGLLVCLFITFLGPESEVLSNSYFAAVNAVAPYVDGKSQLARYEIHRGHVDSAYELGSKLVKVTRFLDSFGYCMLAGILLPPLALYGWEQRKRTER